eukprot:c34757_g1_i1 orf=315-818(-)
MISVRESIVNRSLKPPTAKNAETIDEQYDREIRALRLKQMRYAWKEAEVQQAVSPKKQEKVRRRAELRQAMEEQLKMKETERRQLAEDERNFDRYNEYLRRFSGPHSVEEDLFRQQNKKDYLKALMDENIRLSALKKEMEQKEKQLEAEMDRIRAEVPCTWNRRHYL